MMSNNTEHFEKWNPNEPAIYHGILNECTKEQSHFFRLVNRRRYELKTHRITVDAIKKAMRQ